MQDKLAALREIVRTMNSVLVAFSGGVDSSLVLRVAAEVVGRRCTALTTVSMAVPAHDEERARRFAASLGVRHLVIPTSELESGEYARNPINRCYFCKGHLYRICHAEARRHGISHIADGASLDDLRDHRPGLQAAAEAGVRHPLIEAGLGKDGIRALSRRLGIEAWDRPASPCLSSRIPYGMAITPERLAQVASGERFLRDRGFRELRVRHHDQIARLELPLTDLPRLLDPELRAAVVDHFRRLGFAFVTLDLEGFRSGRLNEVVCAAPAAHEQPPLASSRSA
jgi:uncharacterized protein